MTTTELANRARVGRETIRYYERRGLLEIPKRLGGRRDYSPLALKRLHFIRYLKRLGFTLAEIAEAIGPWSANALTCDEKLSRLKAKLEATRAKREELEAIELALVAQIESCAQFR